MTDAEFEETLRGHQSMVYSIAYNFFRNAALAEEITQDVFLQLCKRPPAIESDLHMAAFLRRVTTNRCIDVLRQRNRRKEVPLEDVPNIPGDQPGADPLLQQRLRRLMASLPEWPRAVLLLRYGEDMSVEEISRTLGISERQVWNHLERAIAVMREKIRGD